MSNILSYSRPLQTSLFRVLKIKQVISNQQLKLSATAHGRRQGGAGGGPWPPPGFSHTLSKSSQISKILPFLVVNTGSILIGPPPKIFLPTPLPRPMAFLIFDALSSQKKPLLNLSHIILPNKRSYPSFRCIIILPNTGETKKA